MIKNRQGVKLSERHAQRKYRRMTAADQLVDAIEASYMRANGLTKKEMEILEKTFSLDIQNGMTEPCIARLRMRDGSEVLVCGIEWSNETYISCSVVDEQGLHALIRVDDVVCVKGNFCY